MLPNRPEKRVNVAFVLSVPALLQLALAPASKSSSNSVAPARRTATLSMPQLSLDRSSSPPSVKRITALAPPAVKLTVTLRWIESTHAPPWLVKPRFCKPRLTTRMSPLVASSGTRTCSRVPSVLTNNGLTATTLVTPLMSRVLNTTDVLLLRWVPRSSITSPTLAEAWAALAGVPSAASAITCVSVATGVAAPSTWVSTL